MVQPSEASAYASPKSTIEPAEPVSRGARAGRPRQRQRPAGEQPAAGPTRAGRADGEPRQPRLQPVGERRERQPNAPKTAT